MLWKLFSDHVVYAASMVPEISDRIVEIDRAMRWGYANKLGPFELWDALGFPATAKRIVKRGRDRCRRTSSGCCRPAPRRSIARRIADGKPRTRIFRPGTRQSLPGRSSRGPASSVLSDLKRARGVVKKNAGASLIDLGDGVLCLEFHSKMNSLGDDSFAMMQAGGRRDGAEFRGDGRSPTRARISAPART